MRLLPQYAYASLDVRNAFGEARRAAMLRATVAHAPEYAFFQASIWIDTTLTSVEKAPGDWHPLYQEEGTAQGDTSSTPCFARGMRAALEVASTNLKAAGLWAQIPSLVDDALLVCLPDRLDEATQIFAEALDTVLGVKLIRSKCKVYCPDRADGISSTIANIAMQPAAVTPNRLQQAHAYEDQGCDAVQTVQGDGTPQAAAVQTPPQVAQDDDMPQVAVMQTQPTTPMVLRQTQETSVDIGGVPTQTRAAGTASQQEHTSLHEWPPPQTWQHPAIKHMEQVQGGLPALGAAYQGDYETVFGPYGVVAEHANKRLTAAI
jgi:hypothetical protein